MSQRIACLIKLCFSHLSFSSLGKLSRAGRCWCETCGHGGAGSAPGHSAPSTSTQHLALTPQTLYKVQGDPEHPLSHAKTGPAPTLQHAWLGMHEPRAWQRASSGQPGLPPPISLKPAGSNEEEMPRRKKSREKQRFWVEKQKSELQQRNCER